MKQFFVVPALGLAALAFSTSARAQIPNWTGSERPSYSAEARQPYYESWQGAYDNGFREGIKQGEKDGRKRAAFDYQDERTWQRADKGYNRAFGNIERYRQQFRAGYAAGYSDGYGRYGPRYGYGRAVPRRDDYPGTYSRNYPGGYGSPGGYGYPAGSGYPGSYGYRSPAYSNGVNDGLQKGREDARDHRSYDPLRHKWYRSGDHDYHGEYGSKDNYRDVYREGFKEGYDRGFREWSYR